MKGAARQRRPSRIWLLTATSLYCRRDKSRALGGGGVSGWPPLSGVSLRPSGRTPPGSRKNCQTSSDHLLSLVLRRLSNPSGGIGRFPEPLFVVVVGRLVVAGLVLGARGCGLRCGRLGDHVVVGDRDRAIDG